MSRAFVKETEGPAFEVPPDRPISEHENFVTPQGLAAIEAELERLDAAHVAAVQAGDAQAIALTEREQRYWTARRASAQVVEMPENCERVQFGCAVTIARDDGRRQTFRIVGEDEADPAKGTISHVSPLARAMFGKSAGDTIQVAGSEAGIVAIGDTPRR